MFNLYGTYKSSAFSSHKHCEHEKRLTSSNHQLYRYSHEPVLPTSLRRDIPPILILLFFLFLIVITLSQILVVHTSRYGNNFSAMQKVQDELRQMDDSMEAILQNNILPIDKWRLLFRIQSCLDRFEQLFRSFDSHAQPIENDNDFKQRLKPLLNKSTELLSKTNHSRNFLQKVEQVHEKLKTIVDINQNSRSQPNKDNFILHSGENSKMALEFCPEQPKNLLGRFLMENTTFPNVSLYEVELNYSQVRSGGRWSPSHCRARHRVAVIIPYRDRFEHLVMLLYYLHPILQRQEIDYKIFVSEQIGNGTYNKAVLMNAAFIHASSDYDFQCFVFHDVDLIPEDDRNMYSCPLFPRHMSVAVDEMNYKLTYEELIGGVFNIRGDHFLTVNGYSNLYWGWGAEDDDLFYRLKEASLKIIRPPSSIARYRMLQHTKRVPSIWNKRAKLLYSAAKRYSWDGISSVQYNMTSIIAYPLFTHLLIDVGSPPPGFN